MVRPVFLKGEAAFTLDGQEYLVVLEALPWMRAEQVAGCSLVTLLARIHNALAAGEEPMVSDLAAVLSGGLSKHHPTLTYEDAINLLLADYPSVSAALNDAIVGSLPQGGPREEDGTAEGNAAAPATAESGTGNSSSPSGAGRGSGSTTSSRRRRA